MASFNNSSLLTQSVPSTSIQVLFTIYGSLPCTWIEVLVSFLLSIFFRWLRNFKWRNKTPTWMRMARSVCRRGIFRCMTSIVCVLSKLRNQLEWRVHCTVKMAAYMKCSKVLSAILPFWQLFRKTEPISSARYRFSRKEQCFRNLLNIRNWIKRQWDHYKLRSRRHKWRVEWR